tara:strand:- start:976 stop:1164 length:189 start_codon:yes stop_codon:yes gene_type:complete
MIRQRWDYQVDTLAVIVSILPMLSDKFCSDNPLTNEGGLSVKVMCIEIFPPFNKLTKEKKWD